MSSSNNHHYDAKSGTFREVSPSKQKHSLFDHLYEDTGDDEEQDSIGELSECTVNRINNASLDNLALADALRRESFSSISSAGTRQQFKTAIDNLRDGLLGPDQLQQQHSPCTTPTLTNPTPTMDSPSDLSPNAPPAGFEDPNNYFANLQGQPIPPSNNGPASTEGSVDSSGFEKVDHDVLEEYGQHFANQMQQSIFGQLPDDPDSPDELQLDSGFLLVGGQSFRMNAGHGEIETLYRIPGDIDKVYPTEKELRERDQMASGQHGVPDDIVGKTYDGLEDDEGLIDIPRNEEPHEPHQEVPHHPHPVETAEAVPHHQPAVVPEDDLLGDFATETAPAYNERSVDSPLVPEVPAAPYHHEEVQPPQRDLIGHEEPINFDQQAQSLVDDAVKQAQHTHDYDHPAQAPIEDAPPLPTEGFTEKIEDDIVQNVVEDVHDEVDDVLERMQENDEFQEMVTDRPPQHSSFDAPARHSDEEEDNRPDFRSQTPEETTYERHGPLTIPEMPEKIDEPLNDDLMDMDQGDVPPPPYSGHGFETVPRPPTPPKDISDEDVKPSLVNLGHGAAPHHAHSDPHHSILKHSSSGSHGGQPWCDFKSVDPRVLELIYWRDPKKSAIALSLTLLALFVLARYPLLSVISYAGLAVLAGTLGFRVFKAIEAQIKKTGGENPFQEYLAKDVSLPQEKVHAQVDVLVEHGSLLANQVKKLVFVESIVDTVKFGLLLWAMTYVASWFSGFAIVIIAVLGVFSVPKFYETYQEPIDAQLAVISGHINNVTQLLEDKLPFLKKAPVAAEEKKDQ